MSQVQATFTHHDQLGRGTWTPLAGFWVRVAASLIDAFVQLLGMLPYLIGLVMLIEAKGAGANIYQSADPTRQADRVTVLTGVGLMVLGGILSMVIWVWNRVVQQGRTGQSIGKAALGIVLVSARTGTPIGAGSAFLREVVHYVVDGPLHRLPLAAVGPAQADPGRQGRRHRGRQGRPASPERRADLGAARPGLTTGRGC